MFFPIDVLDDIVLFGIYEESSMFLNYHHLRYFWAIAHEGNLTRAASRMNVAQSALSIQLRQLEEALGHPLFVRKNRTLALTEAGQMALQYADSIFRAGEELVDTLKHRSRRARQVLRVGAVATLSRNFQWEFVKPLRNRKDVELVLRSGMLRDLIVQLRNHEVDVVLSNHALRRDAETDHYSHLLAEQEVSLVGRPARSQRPFQFPEDCQRTPVILPSLESDIRAGFDLVLHQAGIRPLIAAEVDDMAMLRVVALHTNAVTLVPRVVVKDELRAGLLVERHRLSQVKERFYAITPRRTFPNPLVKELITSVARNG
jgi:LysR family transcriptional regulator, transcriptional activator of nhaA